MEIGAMLVRRSGGMIYGERCVEGQPELRVDQVRLGSKQLVKRNDEKQKVCSTEIGGIMYQSSLKV